MLFFYLKFIEKLLWISNIKWFMFQTRLIAGQMLHSWYSNSGWWSNQDIFIINNIVQYWGLPMYSKYPNYILKIIYTSFIVLVTLCTFHIFILDHCWFFKFFFATQQYETWKWFATISTKVWFSFKDDTVYIVGLERSHFLWASVRGK